LALAESPDRFFDEFPGVVEEIGKREEDVAPALVDAMDGSRAVPRTLAAWFVAQIGQQRPDLIGGPKQIERARKTVIRGLRGPVESQLWACLLLSQGPIPSTASHLRRLADQADERVVILAAAALSRIDAGSSALIATLTRGLHSDNPLLVAVSASAFAELGVFTAHPSLDALGAALLRADTDGHYYILNAIGALGPTAEPITDLLIGYLNDPRRRAMLRGRAAAILARVTKGTAAAFAPLSGALETTKPELLRGVLEGLIELGHYPPRMIERLQGLLSDPDEEMRVIAAHALAGVRPFPTTAVRPLIDRIGIEPSPRMVEALARALGAARASAIGPLIGVIKEHDVRKLPTVSAAFICMGSEGAAHLAQALEREPDEWARSIFVMVLRDLGPAAGPAVPVLASLLDQAGDDEEWAAYLLTSLFVTGPAAADALPSIINSLARGSDGLAEWSEQVLRRIGPPAVAPLQEAIARATGAAKERLRRVLSSIQPVDDILFREYEVMDNDLRLQQFAYVADILVHQGPTRYADMEKLLAQRKSDGIIAYGCSTKARSLALAIADLEEVWGPLTDGRPGRMGKPTRAMREHFPRVQEYLRRKAQRRGEESP
jgi:hypothetical protein